MVNALEPDKVKGAVLPVKVNVSPLISKFWLVSTVREVAFTFDEADRVVGVPLTETCAVPMSCIPEVLSVQVCVPPLAKIIVPAPGVIVVLAPIFRFPLKVKLVPGRV